MTSAPSWRRASARSSSRRTKARTLCPLASSISVRLRPMEPTAPAAPVTRIGLACDDCVVISIDSLDEFRLRDDRRGYQDLVQQSTKVALTLNLKTAKTLGIIFAEALQGVPMKLSSKSANVPYWHKREVPTLTTNVE